MESAMSPEIPHPNSRMVESDSSQPCSHRKLFLHESQFAIRGVTFQSTAPVVPASRSELNSPGDCLMVYVRFPTSISRLIAFGSTKPRFCEGISCAKSRKVSSQSVPPQPQTEESMHLLRYLGFLLLVFLSGVQSTRRNRLDLLPSGPRHII